MRKVQQTEQKEGDRTKLSAGESLVMSVLDKEKLDPDQEEWAIYTYPDRKHYKIRRTEIPGSRV